MTKSIDDELSGTANSDDLEGQLEAANNAVEVLLETLSHDLRTPLNTILGFADMMDQAILGPVENSQYRSYLSDICREGRSMLDILNDVLDRQRFETVERSEKDFRHMIELAPDLISVCRDGVIQLINPAGANMLGVWPIETLVGRRFDEFVHEDFKDLIAGGLEALTDRTSRLPLKLRRVGGADVEVELAALTYTGDGVSEGSGAVVMLMGRDVSERNRALREVGAREDHIRKIMDTVVEGIITIDQHGAIETINPAAEKIFGYEPGELAGESVGKLMGAVDYAAHQIGISRFMQTGEGPILGQSMEVNGVRKDGSPVPLVLSISAFKTGGRQVFIGALHDDTERKASETRLLEMATQDPLTKMPNRNARNERLERAIVMAETSGGTFAFMFVDLDHFKNINDALGHTAGDEVIQMAGHRLEQLIGTSGLVAHLGGDEYSIVVDQLPAGVGISTLADDVLAAMSKPFIVDGKEVFTSASVGVVTYPENGDSLSTLLKNADLAVHAAKRQGTGVQQFYTSQLSEHAERRMDIERGLRRALDNNELHLVFQPKVDLDTRSISGAEALLRWQSPDLGFVSPEEFIPAAEQCGLIGEIGRWVLYTACETAAGWAELMDRHYHVGVNFSAVQFLEPDIVDWVERCISSTGLNPDCLDVELTESMLVENADKTIEVLESLKAIGVTVSMDDFGTGYSSLSYLTRFPLTSLKVDRAFVTNLPEDRDAVAIVRAIISMAQHLGLNIVAEGVETESQVGFLHALGCHTGQGYLFSKPVANDEFRQLIGDNIVWMQTGG
jgi:diguanylate cyclase (GGDEF)-like protein/PAS domain S-box-containing protein